MIAKETENKEVSWRLDDNLHNSPIGSSDVYSVLKNIAEGTDGNQRLGDRIKVKSIRVCGDITINPEYNPDTRVMYVRVIMAQQKAIKQSAAGVVAGIDTAHLLRTGDGVVGQETNFDGTLQKLRYPVNDNKFTVFYDKIFPLMPTGAGGFPLLKAQFSFNKYIKKHPVNLSFDEGAGDYPNNFAPFFCVGYAYADGGAPDIIPTRVQTRVWSRLTYEDA